MMNVNQGIDKGGGLPLLKKRGNGQIEPQKTEKKYQGRRYKGGLKCCLCEKKTQKRAESIKNLNEKRVSMKILFWNNERKRLMNSDY